MSSLSMAGHLLGGPSAALQAAANDIYLEAATGNLIVRLASGTVLTLTPAGALVVPGTVTANGEDVSAAVDALQAAVAALGAPPPSQLVNGGYETNQRGGTVTADLAYAHDRWMLDLGGTSTATITDETAIVDTGSGHALKAVYVQGSAASLIEQKLEQFAQLRGRTVTFAVRVRKGAASSVRPYIEDSGAKTYGATSVTTGAYETLSVTLAIGAASTGVRVGVELSVSDTVYLDNATLAIGSLPMLYVPVDAAVELVRCQRYYQELGGLDVFQSVAICQATSSTAALGPLRFAVEMATAPTITISAAADFQAVGATGAGTVLSTLTFDTITRKDARVVLSVGAALFAGGDATLLRAGNTLNARIRLEANP